MVAWAAIELNNSRSLLIIARSPQHDLRLYSNEDLQKEKYRDNLKTCYFCATQ